MIAYRTRKKPVAKPAKSIRRLPVRQVRERILRAADALFFTYGIHSVSMDDICREVSISKKTFYRFFKDKSALVHMLVSQNINRQRKLMLQMEAEATDPVQHILQALEMMTNEIRRFHATFVYDLQKYFPRSWQHFQRFIRSELTEVVERNLRKGILLGLYRPELDAVIMSRLRIEQIFLAANPNVFPPQQFSIQQVQLELGRHFLYGILTAKGLQTLAKHTSEKKQ
ncbi:MAG: TetR/AcrR family transcriptional regulator [Chitinophagales bacterium]|nr:TetR/AcrR family transcriptional regulator [Chitinophagales bacterium]